MKHFIGVDLGGTHLRAAVVDPQDGSQIAVSKISSEAQKGPETVIDRIVQLVEDVITRSKTPKAQIGGIGIGVPGLVNQEEGRLLIAPNLPGDWADVPLAERISKPVGLPVTLRTRLVDAPGYRKIHDAPVPLAGGWAGHHATAAAAHFNVL